MVIHANGGKITVDISPEDVVMTLADQGPGIKVMGAGHVGRIFHWPNKSDPFASGAGRGLPNMKKYSIEMNIDTVLSIATTLDHGCPAYRY